jgi:ATP-dependent protease HslVU (ClpYQ) peptidase subunit
VTVKGYAVSGNNTRQTLETLGKQRLCWTQRLSSGAHLWFKEVTTRKKYRRLQAMMMMMMMMMMKIIIMTVAITSMLVMMIR